MSEEPRARKPAWNGWIGIFRRKRPVQRCRTQTALEVRFLRKADFFVPFLDGRCRKGGACHGKKDTAPSLPKPDSAEAGRPGRPRAAYRALTPAQREHLEALDALCGRLGRTPLREELPPYLRMELAVCFGSLRGAFLCLGRVPPSQQEVRELRRGLVPK